MFSSVRPNIFYLIFQKLLTILKAVKITSVRTKLDKLLATIDISRNILK